MSRRVCWLPPATMTTFLDANECAHEPFVGASGFGRYPEQQPDELVEALCGWLDVSSRNLTVTRGADEAIDCLLRAFCVPGKDNIIVCPPTFSMYEHSAILQGAATRKVPLKRGFKLDADGVCRRRRPKHKDRVSVLPEQPDRQPYGRGRYDKALRRVRGKGACCRRRDLYRVFRRQKHGRQTGGVRQSGGASHPFKITRGSRAAMRCRGGARGCFAPDLPGAVTRPVSRYPSSRPCGPYSFPKT